MLKRFFSSDGKKKKSLDDSDTGRRGNRKKLVRSSTIAVSSPSKNEDLDCAELKEKKHNKRTSLSVHNEATVVKEAEAQDSAAASDQIGGARPKKKSTVTTEETTTSGRRRAKKKHGTSFVDRIDTSKPLEYPCTPEMVLEYHKQKPFLTANEEWLIVELHEFECLLDNYDIIKIIAKHSKFFEIDPPELWEEFFEFVDDVPSYDEVVNYDVWQEFRDKRYPC